MPRTLLCPTTASRGTARPCTPKRRSSCTRFRICRQARHSASHVAAASGVNHLSQGFLQTVPWLAVLATSASLSLSFASASDSFSPAAAFFACLYCVQSNFLINAMHELGHGYVFKTKFLNAFFMRIVSFLGWLHPDMFFSSHLRHHRFTQNPPLDLENPAPIRVTMRDFLCFGFLNVKVSQSCRRACLQCVTCFGCRAPSRPSRRQRALQHACIQPATWAGLGNGKRCVVGLRLR
jgi:fatty acid desaturase